MAYVRTEASDRLMEAILSLRSTEEAYQLFDDLCTVREVQDMAQRLEIAYLLDNGMKYQDVAAATGVSSATISRVNRCLLYGAGGYKLCLERLRGQQEENA